MRGARTGGDALEFAVVRAAARGVDEAAGDTRDEELVGDDELDDVVERLLALREHRVELLGLPDCAREAVEDEATKGKGFEYGWLCDEARGRVRGTG